jgi:hypothetical protein
MKARTTRQLIIAFFMLAVIFCTLTIFNKCAGLRAETDPATGTIIEEWKIYYEYNVVNGDTIPIDTIGVQIYRDQRTGTPQQWDLFDKCIEKYPSDAVCDSCFTSIFNNRSIV